MDEEQSEALWRLERLDRKDQVPSTTIEPASYDYIRKLVRDRSGIVLEDGKEYLVEARLAPLIRREKIPTLHDLVSRLCAVPFDGLHQKVIEAMTTNETLFFRDARPFEALRDHVLPELVSNSRDKQQLNIWCAACSSGQEPYSLAILAKEFLSAHPGWSIRILASDISAEMVARSIEGIYNQLEINRGLPAPYLVKYFERQGLEWRVQDEIRQRVEFFRMNLIGTWPPLPPMDIIFLRNVLIYFDTETKKSILSKMRWLLKTEGYLFLGGAETTLYLDSGFEQVYYDKAVCYRPRHHTEKEAHAIHGK